MKVQKIVIVLCIFLLAGKVYSKKVEIAQIKQVAVNAFNQEIKSKTGAEAKIVELLPNVIDKDTALYIVNFENSFVIVSAESSTPPLLGYSENSKFDISNAPPALKYLLNCYKKEIKELKKLDAKPTDEINRKWNELSESTQLKSGTPVVDELLTTSWGQGYPYNMFCPSGSAAGCVAVAMAQVLYY